MSPQNPLTALHILTPKNCHPLKIIHKIPEGIALRLRRIYNSDEKHKKDLMDTKMV